MSDHTSETPSASSPIDISTPDDDVIQSFELEESHLRGRSVRLGKLLNDILEPHAYPDPVAHLVAEIATLALLLSSMLKFEGIFTLQAKGDGPVSMLVADVTSEGDVRSCATYDDERLQHAREQLKALKTTESSQNHLAQYLGKGYMAFTVDQQGYADNYQGIVELKGASLVDCVQHYFNQSEQIGTGIKMAVGQRGDVWRAGGIMLQHLPEDQKNAQAGQGNIGEDDWRRSMILMDTTTEDELLDPELHSNVLLLRLFHEEGVRVFEPKFVQKKCRCNAERVESVLRGMAFEALEDLITDEGRIEVKCEFCSAVYDYSPDDFKCPN